MHSVRADYPTDWPHANIYTLADLHIGDEHARMDVIAQRVKEIADDPYGLCICNGDLLNTATKTSVSDIYSEQLSPMQQMVAAVKILDPIKEKIIAVTAGNHEQRIYKTDGIDITRLICRELGIEDKYHADGVLVFLRFGTRREGHHHREKNPKQWYSIYVTHGSGSGRKEGAKAIRLADMASICDSDIYIHGHAHLPMIMKQAFYRVDTSNCCARKVEKLFVNTGAALEYGGYGQAYEFKPGSLCTPVVHLEAAKKCARATL